MEARSVYLGIAVRMRGHHPGALGRNYLHSGLTETYWYAVKENENYFIANLAHGMMIASLYGNDRANVEEGSSQVPKNYRAALETMPYVRRVERRTETDETDALIKEWRELNRDVIRGESPDAEKEVTGG